MLLHSTLKTAGNLFQKPLQLFNPFQKDWLALGDTVALALVKKTNFVNLPFSTAKYSPIMLAAAHPASSLLSLALSLSAVSADPDLLHDYCENFFIIISFTSTLNCS